MNLPAVAPGRGGARLRVRLQPRSRREGVLGLQGDALRIAVHAPPVEGAANEALVRLLARLVDVPRTHVTVVLGATARDKVLEFAGVSELDLDAAMARAMTRSGADASETPT